MHLLRALAFISAILLVSSVATANGAFAAAIVGISVGFAPPPLPIYAQPPIPGPGYIWTPGYWAWGPYGYYWVPGAWLLPPVIGVLWTPPWWAWVGGLYVFHAGYWGPQVGFYGGINYGFGYFGRGYDGGYWRDHRFYYNREVNNLGHARVAHVYDADARVVGNPASRRIGFNGGVGGVDAHPTAGEQAAMRERHFHATARQLEQIDSARSNRSLLATENRGQPPIAATRYAGQFNTDTHASIRSGTGNTVVRPSHPTNGGAYFAERHSPGTFIGSKSEYPRGIPPRHLSRAAPSRFGQMAPYHANSASAGHSWHGGAGYFYRGRPAQFSGRAPVIFGRTTSRDLGHGGPR
ncbi:MAG TPA: YXWGXW repeat-containing protein [Stellaceae bacterium]|nr:YXWGXW repeat-containing protein [Stellaceae bacterium]